MRHVVNAIQAVWAWLLSPSSRKIVFLFIWALVILGILSLFKYVFLTSCVTIGNSKECATSDVNSGDTLFALGGVLVAILAIVPTFWNERRIEDAKKDIERKIFDSVREDMDKVVQAQAMLTKADSWYPNTLAEFREQQNSIERAVALWPPLKQNEYRERGIRMTRDLLFYQVRCATDLKAEMIIHAVRFLEESVANAPDTEALLYLACLYGYRDEYDAMIACAKKAVRLDEDIKEHFRENTTLLMLMNACGNDRDHMEKLGNAIGLELPVSKEGFCRAMRKVDWVTQQIRRPNWVAIKKPGRTGNQGRFIVTVAAANDLNGEEVYASCYHQESMGGDVYGPEAKIGDRDTQVTLEKLYQELDKTFFLICMSR